MEGRAGRIWLARRVGGRVGVWISIVVRLWVAGPIGWLGGAATVCRGRVIVRQDTKKSCAGGVLAGVGH